MPVIRFPLALCVSVVTLAAGAAFAQDGGWRAAPGVPALDLRYGEDAGEAPPCPLPGARPDAASLECWSARIDRSVSSRIDALAGEPALVCVAAWKVATPGVGRCPAEAAQCVRPVVGLFESPADDLPIDSNIQAAWGLSTEIAREYTAFQALRNAHALSPHRPRVAALALAQGLLVLHRAQALASLERQLEQAGCSTQYLLPYFDLAERVVEEVGRSDVPTILESYPPPGREWDRRLHRVQLAALAALSGIRPDGKWREDCERASGLGPRVGRLDADVNAWCGYVYERAGMPDAALEHWRLGRRSANHPEAASYADRQLSRSRSALPDDDVLAGGGGE